MRKSRFLEAQIVGILKEHDAGVPTAELARKHGIHANTLRLWEAKYGGMDTAELARLKQIDDENSRMRRIIANQTLEPLRLGSSIPTKFGLIAHSVISPPQSLLLLSKNNTFNNFPRREDHAS